MYLASVDCGCKRKSGLGDMDYGSLVTGLMSKAYGGGMGTGGAGGGNMPPPGQNASAQTTTTTNVNTQVSPQISPSFVQQSSPNNSPVSTGAVQTMPGAFGIPQTGAMPGFDTAMPTQYNPNGSWLQDTAMQINPTYLLVGSLGLLAVALIAKRRKQRG